MLYAAALLTEAGTRTMGWDKTTECPWNAYRRRACSSAELIITKLLVIWKLAKRAPLFARAMAHVARPSGTTEKCDQTSITTI